MVVRCRIDCQMNTGRNLQRCIFDLQACTWQKGQVVCQGIIAVFQNYIIVIRHREIPFAQGEFIPCHCQRHRSLSGTAADLQCQLSNCCIQAARIAAIGRVQCCSRAKGDQAVAAVGSHQNHGTHIMYTSRVLVCITIHGVPGLHDQIALNILGGVTGRGIDAGIAVRGPGLHTIA